MTPSPAKTSPADDVAARVLEYASAAWVPMHLKQRPLKASDIEVVFEHGDNMFFHIKAHPRKLPDTFLIVILQSNNRFHGHILIDLATEYSDPFLDCPALQFEGVPQPKDIKSLIPRITPD